MSRNQAKSHFIAMLDGFQYQEDGICVDMWVAIYEMAKLYLTNEECQTMNKLVDAVDDYFFVRDMEDWSAWLTTL